MSTYFKAVREDGTSFFDLSFRWLPEGHSSGDPIPENWTVRHPSSLALPADDVARKASDYLSVSVSATECTGMKWPCRLLQVEPASEAIGATPGLPSKRVAVSFRVVKELPATEALGPQGAEVAALIEAVRGLTAGEVNVLGAALDVAWGCASLAARDAARDAAWRAARDAAWRAAWDAARDAARDAAQDAAWAAAWGCVSLAARDAVEALIVRDLISREHYDALTSPVRSFIRIHPEDGTSTDTRTHSQASGLPTRSARSCASAN